MSVICFEFWFSFGAILWETRIGFSSEDNVFGSLLLTDICLCCESTMKLLIIMEILLSLGIVLLSCEWKGDSFWWDHEVCFPLYRLNDSHCHCKDFQVKAKVIYWLKISLKRSWSVQWKLTESVNWGKK